MALRKRLRRTIATVVGASVGVQLLTAGVVSVVASLHRRQRKPSGFPYLEPMSDEVAGNEVTVYTYGTHLYEEMLAEIERASDYIYFESFIWKSDEIGQEFKDALIRAAERGVRVCCTWDVFANIVVPRSFFNFPPIVRTYPYPLLKGGIKFLSLKHSGRDHRKILVIDGNVGFVGGYNIGSNYANKWRDTHARVRGPLVTELESAFVDMWNWGAGHPRDLLPEPTCQAWTAEIRTHCNTPQTMTYPIRNMYLEAIRKASSRVWLTQAYFIPDDDVQIALLEAVERGVDVSVVIPEESNHVMADWLSRARYETLLEGGVKIFLYQKAMIHSKTAVIDSVWSTIGTANLDSLSLLGNYEINLEVFDRSLASTMEDVFTMDLTNCRELSLEEWTQRPFYARLAERILRPLSIIM
ncbi:MAG: phospholipase D-like domain-containing protein [Propionibacteriaceae bacterium]|jgi:cardiolipin synthase|nr:phospholipase D-like domain-containing protein [Propionibacteriaceae bacterium]